MPAARGHHPNRSGPRTTHDGPTNQAILPPNQHTQHRKQPPKKVARPFAANRSKALVWRENSAQHHLSEGGEFPVTEFPERACACLVFVVVVVLCGPPT